MSKFIEQEVFKELSRQGLITSKASHYAKLASDYFNNQLCNSKDPFKDCCDFAGNKASIECDFFKYKSPQAKRRARSKRPQEAFKF